jgi:hypothetical protein
LTSKLDDGETWMRIGHDGAALEQVSERRTADLDDRLPGFPCASSDARRARLEPIASGY